MLAFLALVSCSFPLPDCASGYSRDSSDECTEIPGYGDDTGHRSGITGEYSGEIILAVLADAGGLVIEDECVGAIAFDRRGSALDGTVECRFQGSVDGLVSGQTFEGDIDGSFAEDDSASGQIVLDLDIFGVLDEPWSGSASADQISGTIVGEMDFEVAGLVVPVGFVGQFETNR